MDKEQFVTLTYDTFHLLESAGDLSPNNEDINTCLSAFVSAVLNNSHDTGLKGVLKDDRLQRIRPKMMELLSRAEYEMETHFGEYFASKENVTPDTLEDFWYRGCYERLVQHEVNAYRGICAKDDDLSAKKIAFVGAGPLPLTMIDWHLQTGADVTGIDISKEACDISNKIFNNMGLSDTLRHAHSDGQNFDYTGFDLVEIAALVPNKARIAQKVRADAPNAIIAIRSVEGLKGALYEQVNLLSFRGTGLRPSVKTPSTGDVINTTIFLKPTPSNAPECDLCGRCIGLSALDAVA